MHPDPRVAPGWHQELPPRTGWWYLVPLFTCGYGTPFMVIQAGVKLRSRRHILLGFGYFAVIATLIVSASITTDSSNSATTAVNGLLPLLLWVGGTIHVAMLQAAVRKHWWRIAAGRYQHPVAWQPPGAPVDPALAAAQWRAARRGEARQLQATQPAMANELMIGRPDLPGRQYDDGGLVDVNHVPADWLVRYLTIDRDLADRIVEARELHNGFASAEELIVYCDGLTPAKLDLFRDRLLFVPR